MSTFMAKPETVARRWFVIDATDQVVGRLAVQIANILRGKRRPEYTPHVDTGEFVVVVNAEKIRFFGSKPGNQDLSLVYALSGRPEGRRAHDWLVTHPDRILEAAVRRIVAQPLGRQQMTKLKIYKGGERHPHQAQRPQAYKTAP